jgi:hypothetical protein
MFYLWLVDEGAATREGEPAYPLASDHALPNCDSAIDAIELFDKPARVRSHPICRFVDF